MVLVQKRNIYLVLVSHGNFPVLAGPQMDPTKSLKKVLKPEFLGK